MPIREFLDRSLDPTVRGYIHEPETSSRRGLVLTHGAGSNANALFLIALAGTFCTHGFTVLRCDLPYRQMRSFGPPGPADGARDRAGLKNAIVALRKILGAPFNPEFGLSGDFKARPPSADIAGWGSIFLGGHSYGGRQSSMLCAELSESDLAKKNPEKKDSEAAPRNADFVGWEPISGLLLLSYPLHPPRKPDQQRTQHLPNLRTPSLFVSGTRDPFGTIAEIQHALKMIPARTSLISIEGAGHDLNFKGKSSQGKEEKQTEKDEKTTTEGKTKKADLPTQIYSDFINFFSTTS